MPTPRNSTFRVGPLDEDIIPVEYVYLDRLGVKEAGHIMRPSRVGRVRIERGVGDRDIGSNPGVTKENAHPRPGIHAIAVYD
jgi:hypothetical protein